LVDSFDWVKLFGAWVKVKVKFNLQQAVKAQRDNRGIALLFLCQVGDFNRGAPEYKLVTRAWANIFGRIADERCIAHILVKIVPYDCIHARESLRLSQEPKFSQYGQCLHCPHNATMLFGNWFSTRRP
jgi:hypothetical protein